jgi:hypothetical protein
VSRCRRMTAAPAPPKDLDTPPQLSYPAGIACENHPAGVLLSAVPNSCEPACILGSRSARRGFTLPSTLERFTVSSRIPNDGGKQIAANTPEE